MDKLERVKSHMAKFDARAPVEAILEDYEDEATLEAAGTKIVGKQEIGKFFERAMQAAGDARFEDVEYKERDDGSVEVSWKLGPMPGGDRFFFGESGLFKHQKAYMGARPKDF